MIAVEPSVISVTSLIGAAWDDLCIGEGFEHGFFDC